MRSRRLITEPPPPPPERSFWQLLPRRNFRRALLLIIAIVAVIAIKHTGGLSLNKLFDQFAPLPTRPAAPAFQHLQVRPPPPAPRPK
ncbi:MAG TPA: hypothetical protein VHO06_13320 [Polyangia bacterium]|nr:hypothetical protein [Polyangia bacterium]